MAVTMNLAEFIEHAERHCLSRGCRLTALRRQILHLVLRQNGVVKAYQILAELQKERAQAAPPTVYRALDFLVEQGLLHRVEALNGFVVCDHIGGRHDSLFLHCQHCGVIREVALEAAMTALSAVACQAGFTLMAQSLVLTGLCPQCRAQDDQVLQ